MTSAPNEPLEFSTSTDDAYDAPGQEAEELLGDESELAAGGHDDRQQSPEESDREQRAHQQEDRDGRHRAEEPAAGEQGEQPRHRP